MKNTYKIPIIIVFVAGLAVISYLSFRGTPATAGQYDAFAQCLTEKGAMMYGTYWCPHCQNEKKAFGDSFRFVNYVECTQDPKKCTAAKIEGYPTWTFPDGRRFEGEQGLQKLSEESTCPLPALP
jgi:hypothetical protein